MEIPVEKVHLDDCIVDRGFLESVKAEGVLVH